MLLQLPKSLHYPITITKVVKRVGDSVALNDALFLYSYTTTVKVGSRYGDDDEEVEKKFVTQFPSIYEGTVKGWRRWEGDVLNGPVDICEIEEECAHAVQYLGMCTNCGKDMTSVQAGSETTDADRAPIQMAHDTRYLTISKEEAQRIDEEAKRRLLSQRKLSLVVDLDQTIIHAACDPTIGEWQEDKDNPNHQLVRDVRKFQLADEGAGPRGTWYYIKLRPGLSEFLDHVAELYELHIYTAGTRNYAQQIAKIVDPTGKYFGDRILSRDESPSISAKYLERLFPIDTKMVIIIDDRADVWRWNPNLIRVTPYEFFVGIGDINSSFLPKKQDFQQTPKVEAANAGGPDKTPNGTKVVANGDSPPRTPTDTNGTSALEHLIAISGPDDPVVREMQAKGQEEIITSQLEEKPLEKMQREQDEKDEAAAAASSNGEALASQSTESDSSDSSDSSESSSKPRGRHSILKDDDEELVHLEAHLTKVHHSFFAGWDRERFAGKGGRVAQLTGAPKAPAPSELDEDSDLSLVPDVKDVMPAMKRKVLRGVCIVFSGVFPLGTDIQTADISTWAKSFGAQITDKVTREATHLIAARPGTAKVKQAVKKGVKVVSTQWLIGSMQRWRRLDERPYLLEGVGKHKDQVASIQVTAEEYPLSSSDGETPEPDTDADAPAQKKIRLENGDGPVDATEAQLTDTDGDEDDPPMDDADWADMNAELAEFMGSDVDSESDTESVKSLSLRKRKRDGDQDEDPDAPPRKRSEVGSGLKTVTGVESLQNSESADTPRNGDGGGLEEGKVEVEDDEEEDDSGDELARELEREMDEADAEEEAARLAAG